MRIVFLGTPKFGQIVLEYLVNSKHQIDAVVCQPDKPNARGNKMVECEVKTYAKSKSIPVYQFDSIKKEGVETLKQLNPDVIVTAAYGQLLSKEILDIAKYGVINVHGSILPKYRGASPIQYALLKGETETGVTIMKTDVGMDDGDILLIEKCEILESDNTETLSNKLANLGGKALVDALELIENDKAVFVPQNHEEATFTKMLEKKKSYIKFELSARRCLNKIRAYNPNPVAKMVIDDVEFKVFSAKVVKTDLQAKNGEVIEASSKKGLIIKCAEDALEIVELSAPNGKRMLAKAYLNGKTIEIGRVANENIRK